ncbi:MAG: hypothetical protein AMXMBFR82_14090 [Candidatus Hydrogenedentota bacterium]
MESDRQAILGIVDFLYPGWKGESRENPPVPQGLSVDEPTDYWTRYLSEDVPQDDIRDQQVLKAMVAWRDDERTKDSLNAGLAVSVVQSPKFAAKVEQFGPSVFDDSQVMDLASQLFGIIRCEDNRHLAIGRYGEIPGFLELWRLMIQGHKTVSHDAYRKWLVAEVKKALPVNLLLASELLHYYSIRNENEVKAGRSQKHLELWKGLGQIFQDAYENNLDVFVESLGEAPPFALYHFVRESLDSEIGLEALRDDDWKWFPMVWLRAVEIHPATVLPEIVVTLVGPDKDHAIRGNLMGNGKKIFGDQFTTALRGIAKEYDLGSLAEDLRVRVENVQKVARELLREQTSDG